MPSRKKQRCETGFVNRECKTARKDIYSKTETNASSNLNKKPLTQLFKSLNNYTIEENILTHCQSSSIYEQQNAFDSTKLSISERQLINKNNSLSKLVAHLVELLHAMYLVTFTQRAQMHNVSSADKIKGINMSLLKNKGQTDANIIINVNKESKEESKSNLESNTNVNVEHSHCCEEFSSFVSPRKNGIDEHSLKNTTEPVAYKYRYDLQTKELTASLEKELYNSNKTNDTIVSNVPYVSSIIDSRWRDAVEQCCHHTVHLDNIARVAFIFQRWISVKWYLTTSSIASTHETECEQDSTSSNVLINENETEQFCQNKEILGHVEEKCELSENDSNLTYRRQLRNDQLTAKIYYLQTHVPSVEELTLEYKSKQPIHKCSSTKQAELTGKLEHITAYNCYLEQSSVADHRAMCNSTDYNKKQTNVINYDVNEQERNSMQILTHATPNTFISAARNTKWQTEQSKENVLCQRCNVCNQRICKCNVLSNSLTVPCNEITSVKIMQEKKATNMKEITSFTSQDDTETKVTDDELLRQISPELRASLSKYKLHRMLEQMRREITRADERYKEELEREQACERVVHSYEHICALFTRAQCQVNAWNLIQAMESESRFDDEHQAAKQLDLLLQYPESGLRAMSVDVHANNLINCTSKCDVEHEYFVENKESELSQEQLCKDKFVQALPTMHNITTIKNLQEAELKCVLVEFDRNKASLQKLIKSIQYNRHGEDAAHHET